MHSIFQIIDESTDSAGPDLVSLADLKLVLGITGSDEDEALQTSITFQSRIIAEYCDRRFGRAEALETFTFDPGEVMPARQPLKLSLYPVAEIHEVSTAGATASDFEFDPSSGQLWMPTSRTEFWMPHYDVWNFTISVTYSGGYDLPEEAPARLTRAVINAVNESRQSGTRDPTIREVQHGDTRTAFYTPAFSSGSSSYLSASVTDLIRPYRRLSVA